MQGHADGDIDAPSIAPPAHLFTWVDVDEHLVSLAAADRWPEWLLEADAWWDHLELTVLPGTTEDKARAWLDEAFGLGSVGVDTGRLVLALDRPGGLGAEGIPVVLLPAVDHQPGRRTPRLAERRTTAELTRPLTRPKQDRFPGDVQVIAFHSFKGGVGRTVHAVALADELARKGHGVLLVDADLEAPGITWMHQAQGSPCDIGYEDVLALLHGTTDGDTRPVADMVAEYIAGQYVAVSHGSGRLAVLPVGRRNRLGPPRIEPIDLLTHDRPAYFLTESLAEVAGACGLDTVIMDLRAGASELSAPVLLDPRVQRVFVTTLSSQSLDGTRRMIRQLGAKAPALLGRDPAPAAILTQFWDDVHSAEVAAARRSLSRALYGAADAHGAQGQEAVEEFVVDTQVLTEALISPFRDELLALPRSWREVVAVVRRCGLGDRLEQLAPGREPQQLPALGAGVGVDVEEGRRKLHDRASSLVFAERSGLDSGLGFLSTEPLRRLVGDHHTALPVSVVVGAKGAGKTFTYARLCVAGTWGEFAKSAGAPTGPAQATAPVVPVLDPDNIDQFSGTPRAAGPQELRDRVAGGDGASREDIRQWLRDGLSGEDAQDQDYWTAKWLACLALAAGEREAATWAGPTEILQQLGRRPALFVIDGLEDFFQTIDSEAKRVALRSLLIDVPTRLRSLRGSPLGLVVFVRRDLASAAIRQNLGQFLDRYKPYALRWDAREALRLALWVAVTAQVVEVPERDLTDLDADDISRALLPVWGAKLGSDRSREAGTDRWVPAALADFNEQVQARDVVRFLSEAARLSVRDDRTDRLLVPTAMRRALAECSREKIREIAEEDSRLGRLLDGLSRFSSEVLMPFDSAEVGLDAEGIAVLEEAGALAKDPDGRYRLPEIYRHALGFRTRGRARVVRSP
ncbi:AAA family ATPase [Streptomyces sp. B1866]|uniref:KGGVGR-motif variant AAA ATPase n=1 Tax=Streptomyces sp. B1866 TaxID=3075431 RepID=UPI002891D729|nr:AAA family ATPase [Streptomyces sp. B1866]MDT3397486.1 AAA family ATPase [Streptomyces sp. B1866]